MKGMDDPSSLQVQTLSADQGKTGIGDSAIKIRKNCPVCNTEFVTTQSRIKHGRGVTCSRKCQYELNKLKSIVQFKCANCGDEFARKKSSIKSKYQFCSNKCAYEARSKGIIRRIVTKPYKILNKRHNNNKKDRPHGKDNYGKIIKRKQYPNLSDLQIGKAGEYLVCADLILKGHIAFLSEQGLPFDLVLNYQGKLFKVQVKTTATRRATQRKHANHQPFYLFHVGRNGKKGRRNSYKDETVDIFALIELETKHIAYLPATSICGSSMLFRIPSNKGMYFDEKIEQQKCNIKKLVDDGLNISQIAKELNLQQSNVYRYCSKKYANKEKRRKKNKTKYMDDFSLEKCMGIILETKDRRLNIHLANI